LAQLGELERRTSRGGRDSIDHGSSSAAACSHTASRGCAVATARSSGWCRSVAGGGASAQAAAGDAWPSAPRISWTTSSRATPGARMGRLGSPPPAVSVRLQSSSVSHGARRLRTRAALGVSPPGETAGAPGRRDRHGHERAAVWGLVSTQSTNVRFSPK
jgi:hypothetical protein